MPLLNPAINPQGACMVETKAIENDHRPRFAIIGGGATGGFLGAHLARAGYAVTLIARGAHLEAIRRSGLVLNCPDGSSMTAYPDATDQIEAVADSDVVFLTLKAHSISA